MKLKIPILILLTLPVSLAVSAQTDTLPSAISLEQARQIALKNNPDFQSKSISVSMAQKNTEKAKWTKIPDIYANYDLQRNLIVPVTPVPAEAFDPNAKPGELRPVKFSTDYTSNIGLNASWDLFNPETHGQVKEAQQQAGISEIDRKLAENDLRFKVGKDYAACIIAQNQLDLALADTTSKAKLLQLTEEKYNAGRIKINELNQIMTDRNTALGNYLNAQKILNTSRAQLLVDMGFNPSGKYSFELSDSLKSILPEGILTTTENTESLSVQKVQQQRELTEIKLSNIRGGFLPTISLNGFYGANYFDNDFDLFKNENWYGNSFVNVKLEIPLTRGIDRVKEIDRLKLQAQADQADYRAKQNEVALERIKAQEDFEYKKKDLSNKKKSMKLSQGSFQTATEQFENGRLLAGDLSKISYQYQQAKTNYLQAMYDYIVAGLQLEKVNRE